MSHDNLHRTGMLLLWIVVLMSGVFYLPMGVVSYSVVVMFYFYEFIDLANMLL